MSNLDSTDLIRRLNRLNEIGIALSTKQDIRELMEIILLGAKELTNADGGTLYSVTEQKTLRFEILRTDSLGLSWGGLNQDAVAFDEIPLYDMDGNPNEKMVVCYSVLNEQTVNIPDVYHVEGFDFGGTRQFDIKTGYHSKSFLTVPMKDERNEVIGVLQLLNAMDAETGSIIPFSEFDQQLAESLASQAAIALNNSRLITSLNAMLESFIESIAQGIDEQSRYTGNHCRRVPVIAMLLAEAVNQDNGNGIDGEFTKEDLYELRIASLLHDCGKVAIPIHLMDKSSRQETVMDKIELMDMRFIVLQRDAEIAMLKRKLDGSGMVGHDDEYTQRLQHLEEYRQFLQESNRASTEMSLERQERVQEIAQESWRDYADEERPLISSDELTNFFIRRGTLNDKEREAINHHVVSSIKMLANLPYPRHLRRIPEIAGGHHEWINGKGYPKGLQGQEMSLQARLLCIADVFEALTASDRPYKEPMPLSQALRVLEKEKEKGHLDADLVDIFIREKVYLKYAQEYLLPEQVDVD